MTEASPGTANSELQQILDAARSVWMRRLTDHSRANSLLFYRPLKIGTLDLTEEKPAVERLLTGEALSVDALVATGHHADTHEPVVRARSDTGARERVRAALVALQRKALSNREEKGIETLHLAFGQATWPAEDGGRPYDAPVLLLPARIEALGRAGDDLRLLVMGEPRLNPVLLHVLEEEYHLRLDGEQILRSCSDEATDADRRIRPACVCERLEQAAAPILLTFLVRPRTVLANFQFAKMAMVEDIRKNGEAMAKSAVIRAIAGHKESRQQLAQAADLDPRALDSRPPASDFLVLDADSTQQRAIVLIGTGQSGVVQGPPGSGKSQTIANLIAQSVADGRRVLFVAEKRAALEAVIKRLNHPDVGLGHLVLDLHGASVSRKEVMTRLADVLDQIRYAQPAVGAEAVHSEFETRRRQLNQHAERINMPREPTGMSVNGMMGRLLRLTPAARSLFRLRRDTLRLLTPDRANAVRDSLQEGAANPALLLGTDASPWNNADITDGNQAQEALDVAAAAAYDLWPKFERLLGTVVDALGILPPTTLADVNFLLVLLRDTQRVRLRYSTEVFSEPAADLRAALEPAGRGRGAAAWAFLTRPDFRAARRRLLVVRKTPAPTATLFAEAEWIADVQRRWQEMRLATSVYDESAAESELGAVHERLSLALARLAQITEAGSLEAMPVTAVGAWVRALAADTRTPYLLPNVHNVRRHLHEAGLGGLLSDLCENAVQATDWTARFEYVWLYSALEEALASDQALAGFKGRTHEQLVTDFVRLDRERVRLAAQRVLRLHAERAIDAQNRFFEQADLVRSEARKKSRHIPLRELLSRAPDVLTRIAPCWVASPLSVSQLLDGSRSHFDIVVFDEASQVLQEEAIPALYRAEQVVAAGDRHQLPPTTFFATAVEGEDDVNVDDKAEANGVTLATAAIGGYESLLDTLEAFLPNWMLEWHYRSEDERLIGFSNAYIYSGRLVTLPSARGHDVIRHVHIPHESSLGGQEESASREVEEVIRLVIAHAEERPDESLGVITMGIKHANRIQAVLDRTLELRPDLADFFALDREERFFVKNLETVQGDERDAIILSVGYGKSANGDLPHRFGPLTQETGHRRLNVAVTRARRRMTVVSSFLHHDVDLSRSGSRGVQLLKAFLEYAASGGARLPEPEDAGKVELNSFEADIRDALESRGIRTRPQYGASRYRIDLVAMHPDRPGRPVLAIECDGAAYHSSATARDRDRLRQAFLQRLGWRFHRVWSTDWFYSREEEIERAVAAFNDAVQRADREDVGALPGTVSQPGTVPGATVPPNTYAGSGSASRAPRPELPVRGSIKEYTDAELRRLAEWVASDGLLLTEDEVIREMFAALPFKRLGSGIRARLKRAADAVTRKRHGE